jgi:hypothetical protein
MPDSGSSKVRKMQLEAPWAGGNLICPTVSMAYVDV